MTNPFENRDLTKRLTFPVISWSSMSQFLYWGKDEWFLRYVKGIRGETNENMRIGTEIGERWATDDTFLPDVERPEIFEQELEARLNHIQLVGHLDGLSLTKKKKLFEMKTSVSDTKWTHATVKKHGQIDFYVTLLWLNYKIKPEDVEIELIYVPVVMNPDGKIIHDTSKKTKVIPTTRTMHDILKFCSLITKTHKEMQEHVIKLSTII